jgi:hypothetical protein
MKRLAHYLCDIRDMEYVGRRIGLRLLLAKRCHLSPLILWFGHLWMYPELRQIVTCSSIVEAIFNS